MCDGQLFLSEFYNSLIYITLLDIIFISKVIYICYFNIINISITHYIRAALVN